MILSHRHKFVFFKQMKSAGSSIELALTPFCGPDDIMTGTPYKEEVDLGYIERNNKLGYRQLWHQHTPPAEFLKTNVHTCRDYFKFVTIRNPFDAIVSYFWWSFYSPDSTLKNHILKPVGTDGTLTLKNKFMTFLQTYASFNTSGNQEMIADWFASRYHMFYHEPLDYTLKYESLDLDFSIVCGMIGLQPINLPKLKGRIRKSPFHYSDYYNPVSYDIVANRFEKILSDFDYSFDN